ncbi:protein arginine N-methyltransferase 5 [Rhodnius prolixus]|uniref:protein arginine N-methyltransferase 5 n=1 Tax=Rhodnius prolixus TaxID=13249 RepID=UPI003D18E66E
MVKITSCGLDFPTAPNLKKALAEAVDAGYAFICVPIAHPRYKRVITVEDHLGKVDFQALAFTRSDLLLSCQDWNNLVLGKTSEWIDLDSCDEKIRSHSEEVLNQEIMFATHLGLPAALIRLHGPEQTNLARFVCGKVSMENIGYQADFWFIVPMISPKVQADYYRSDVPESKSDENDTWHWWNNMRLTCASDRKIGLCLELSADLPSQDILNRWLGEPIKNLMIPTSLFLTNRKGFPVLSHAHQAFLKLCALQKIQLLLTGANRHSSYKHYVQYLEHVYQLAASGDDVSSYSKGFEDHLQIPLQPLMDNLESNTYEVFEKDPVKYTEYRHAIYQALVDRVPEDEADKNVQVVMVVGAGRGPLVNAALYAANSANRKIKCYAVEKNPNAIVTLYSLKAEEWGDKVEVVACDMRLWNPPEKCDILVSELLGSFGDNELSPECLDGAQMFLKDDGISIPCEYTSHLCPLQSHKLYNEAKHTNQEHRAHYTRFEMPYVVHQLNTFSIAPVQPLFTFVHPNKDPVKDNRRFKKLTFKIEQDSVLHGFSGYFDTVLYKDIRLSIVPKTYSTGMFSWFPIYFPIQHPISLKKGDELEVNFWRLINKKIVWYEWSVSKPVIVPIHNSNGRSHNIGLF